MITWAAAAGIAVVALGLVLTPGPNMMYLVSRSITQGRRAGLISLAGVGVGFLGYLAATAAGLTVVFTLVPGLYLAVKIAGAGYLLWLAWQTLRPGGGSPFAPKPLPVDRPRRLFTMGMVTNLLNPKIAILYVSLLPQFIDPVRGDMALQGVTLGLIQIGVALTMNAVIVLTAGALAGFLGRRPAWLRIQRLVMGTALAAIAVRLLTDRARPALATP